ncbi:MAG: hypothetical protein GX640_13505, partial [Fibrobacter sp.]|nr:hypothetical protein [Fibrobacter sp.]
MTIQVNVLFGGPSAEHEVSLNSAQGVIANLSRDKYRIRAVFVSKNKEFYFRDITGNIPEVSDLSNTAFYTGPFSAATSGPVWEDCAVAFLA